MIFGREYDILIKLKKCTVAMCDGMEIKMRVTKETLIGDILDYDVETAQFFFEIGMHCLGCPHSRGESIADACFVHGTNADELVASINNFLAGKETK